MAKKMAFEESMTRLEEIVSLLGRGDAPLNQALSLFEEGAKLTKECTAQLDKAAFALLEEHPPAGEGYTVEELAAESEGRYKVCKVDVNAAPGLVQQFRIMSVPTVLIVSEGQEALRLVGWQDKAQLLQALNSISA